MGKKATTMFGSYGQAIDVLEQHRREILEQHVEGLLSDNEAIAARLALSTVITRLFELHEADRVRYEAEVEEWIWDTDGVFAQDYELDPGLGDNQIYGK